MAWVLLVERGMSAQRTIAALLTLFSTGSALALGDEPPPDHPGLIRRKVQALKEDAEGTGRGLHLGPLFPGVAILSSGAGPGPILRLWTPDILGTRLDMHASASYSIHRYQYYDAQVGLIPTDGGRLPHIDRGTGGLFPLSELERASAAPGFGVYASARHRNFPAEDFYGIGSSSLRANRTDFALKDTLVEGVVQYRVGDLSLMGRVGVGRTSIGGGNDSNFPGTELTYLERTAPGLKSPPDYTQGSISAWIERRDQPLDPHRGASFGLSVARFSDRGTGTFRFNQLIVDAREYLPLGSRHVLALRQVAFLDRPDASSQVPFYMLPTFGGSTFLRGYGSSRYRDNKLLALGAEYRFELQRHVQLALIYEAGSVFRTMRDLGTTDVDHSYGVGIRLKSLRRVRFRIDLLKSPERTRVDFKLGPSF